jgi:hypothetical protein
MASTVTRLTSSAHSLVYTIAGTLGNTDTARSDVLAACAEGPLKDLLTHTADWTVFNLSQPKNGMVVVREVMNRAAGGPEASTFLFTWLATGFRVSCSATIQLEIRLSHSSRR